MWERTYSSYIFICILSIFFIYSPSLICILSPSYISILYIFSISYISLFYVSSLYILYLVYLSIFALYILFISSRSLTVDASGVGGPLLFSGVVEGGAEGLMGGWGVHQPCLGRYKY